MKLHIKCFLTRAKFGLVVQTVVLHFSGPDFGSLLDTDVVDGHGSSSTNTGSSLIVGLEVVHLGGPHVRAVLGNLHVGVDVSGDGGNEEENDEGLRIYIETI